MPAPGRCGRQLQDEPVDLDWAMNANSRNKLPAWLFIQWATGKDSLNKAVEGGTYADPVRQSVFDTTFKRVAASQPAISKRLKP